MYFLYYRFVNTRFKGKTSNYKLNKFDSNVVFLLYLVIILLYRKTLFLLYITFNTITVY